MNDSRDATRSDLHERGRHWGAYFKAEGRDYGKVYGHYPSCPSHRTVTECDYCKGYEEASNG